MFVVVSEFVPGTGWVARRRQLRLPGQSGRAVAALRAAWPWLRRSCVAVRVTVGRRHVITLARWC